jgi:hypothetical protein
MGQGLKSLDFARDLEFTERQVKGVPTLWSTPERVEMAGRTGPNSNLPIDIIPIPYNPQILIRNKTDWYQIALKYQQKIITGKVKSKAEIARMEGVSRARITQIMNWLKND